MARKHITIIAANSLTTRLVAILVAVLAICWGWFAISWQLGELFAEATTSKSANAFEIAESAIRLAPSSPSGYWLSGAVLRSAFDDESLSQAITQYQAAAQRAPFDYRSWTELGRVNEQAGNYVNAELAFGRSAELAPEYTIPRWNLGNFYLRRSRIPDAVQELQNAAKYNTKYRVQVFSTAWNTLGQDPARVEEFLTESEDSKAALAYFYGRINRPEDALRVWNLIPSDQKPRFTWQLHAITSDLLRHSSYRGALEFSRQAGIDPESRVEAISNGDFELPVGASDGRLTFDWDINRIDGKIDVAEDSSTVHGGRRSLRVRLRGYAKPAFNLLQQAVAVEPGQKYRLSFFVRTEDLRGGSLPFVEVRNSKSEATIGTSKPFPSGTNNWEQFVVEFAVPPDRDGVYLIMGREPCADECPMMGVFWLDDFSLGRI